MFFFSGLRKFLAVLAVYNFKFAHFSPEFSLILLSICTTLLFQSELLVYASIYINFN